MIPMLDIVMSQEEINEVVEGTKCEPECLNVFLRINVFMLMEVF